MAFLSPSKIVLATALCAGFGAGALAGTPTGTVPPAVAAVPATASAAVPATTQPASPTVATVNGKDMSASDLDQETRTLQSQYARQIPPDQMARYLPQLRQQAMQNMVNKQLLLEDAAGHKMAVSDDEVKKAVAQYTQSVPPGETLEGLLARAGVSMKDFHQQTIDGLLLQKFLAEELKGVTATDEDAAKYYKEHPDQFKSEETVSARHILVTVARTDDAAKKAEKKKKIDGIRERLIKGEDFSKVCAETSEDPGSKDKGGLYENFPRGQMVPPFDNAAFTQKVGEIGPVIETSFGYHIIKVEKHNQAGAMPLSQVNDRLKTYLENRKKQETVQKLIETLREHAKITYAEGEAAPATQPVVK